MLIQLFKKLPVVINGYKFIKIEIKITFFSKLILEKKISTETYIKKVDINNPPSKPNSEKS
tara:strand:- start:18 stop:200 length:183 start_codon:yes stop_codon:yes gene_type:complete